MKKGKHVVFVVILIIFLTSCSAENNVQYLNADIVKESIAEEKGLINNEDIKENDKIVSINERKINIDSIFNYEDLLPMTEEELSILRNSIYAKYGYKFKSQKYRDYFSKYDWYEPKYDDVNSYLQLSDLKNIDLILKLEKNFIALSDNLTDIERALIGFWNRGAGVGAGYSDRYRFYSDRSFEYSVSTMVFDERIEAMQGKWFVLEDRLLIQIRRKRVINGGELVEATHPGAASDQEIVGGKYEIKEISPPEIKILTLGFESEKIEKDYALGILIEDIDFYRLSQDPDFDIDEEFNQWE